MKRSVSAIAITAFGALCLFALPTVSANNNKPANKQITFTKDIAPILFKNCAGCHRPDDIAPFSVLSYNNARPWAKSSREKVASREMPPWGADPRHGEFSNDARLKQNEIDAIVAWVDGGAKEGDPKDMPPAPDFSEDWKERADSRFRQQIHDQHDRRAIYVRPKREGRSERIDHRGHSSDNSSEEDQQPNPSTR